jgi:hypothetical protein
MLQSSVALLVYFLALFVTILLMAGWLPTLAPLIVEHCRTGGNRVPILVAMLIGAGYLAGGVAGWALRPPQWGMPFARTFEAALNAEKYGHALESRAERVLMYPWYMAVLFSILVAVAAALVLRLWRRRPAGAVSVRT